MQITIYAREDSPELRVLEARMIERDIPFKFMNEPSNPKPVLRVGDRVLSYEEAVKWIKTM